MYDDYQPPTTPSAFVNERSGYRVGWKRDNGWPEKRDGILGRNKTLSSSPRSLRKESASEDGSVVVSPGASGNGKILSGSTCPPAHTRRDGLVAGHLR